MAVVYVGNDWTGQVLCCNTGAMQASWVSKSQMTVLIPPHCEIRRPSERAGGVSLTAPQQSITFVEDCRTDRPVACSYVLRRSVFFAADSFSRWSSGRGRRDRRKMTSAPCRFAETYSITWCLLVRIAGLRASTLRLRGYATLTPPKTRCAQRVGSRERESCLTESREPSPSQNLV